jgi:hypothetical protein
VKILPVGLIRSDPLDSSNTGNNSSSYRYQNSDKKRTPQEWASKTKNLYRMDRTRGPTLRFGFVWSLSFFMYAVGR